MKKILVCVDCQNDFISGSLASKKAEEKIPNIVKKIKDFNGDYIFMTRDTHEKNYLDTKEGKKLPVMHCVKDSWGWEIEDSVASIFIERINDDSNVVGYIIDKPTFGSEELIKEISKIVKNEECEIEIVGFVSSICVICNTLLLKTFLYENSTISVDSSCIAGLSEENNNAAIEVLKSCQINIY